jgi:hypothetical protein
MPVGRDGPVEEGGVGERVGVGEHEVHVVHRPGHHLVGRGRLDQLAQGPAVAADVLWDLGAIARVEAGGVAGPVERASARSSRGHIVKTGNPTGAGPSGGEGSDEMTACIAAR